MGFCKAHGAQRGHCFRIKPVGVSGYPPVSLLAAAEIQTQRHQQVGLLRRKSLETSASISFENRRSPASHSSRRQIDVWIFTVFEEPARDSQNVTLLWTPPFLGHLGHLGMGSTTTHPGTRRRLLRPPSCWRRGWHVWPGKTLKLRVQFWGVEPFDQSWNGDSFKKCWFHRSFALFNSHDFVDDMWTSVDVKEDCASPNSFYRAQVPWLSPCSPHSHRCPWRSTGPGASWWDQTVWGYKGDITMISWMLIYCWNVKSQRLEEILKDLVF